MLHVVGDINFTDSDFNVGFGIGSRITQGFDPLKNIAPTKSDIFIGNFEGVASKITDNSGIHSKRFRIDTSYVGKLTNCNIYGVANNHVMQHGPKAYNETLSAISDNCLGYFGSNDNKTFVFEHNKKKISITGLCYRIEEFDFEPLYWHNPELKDIQAEFNNIPNDCFKIVYLHWGNEFVNCPSETQIKLAHWLVDLGFDLIVGMHSHVLQGFEEYKGKYIFYSIGNCLFDMAWEPTKYGAMINVDLEHGEPIISYKYIKIINRCTPVLIENNDLPKILSFDYLNTLINDHNNSEVYHNKVRSAYQSYRAANRKVILGDFIKHPLESKLIILDFLKRKFK